MPGIVAKRTLSEDIGMRLLRGKRRSEIAQRRALAPWKY
jgi:hypothetical protein